MAMDVICSIAFGVEVNSCKTPDIELLAKAKELIRSHSIENKLFILSGKNLILLLQNRCSVGLFVSTF